MVGSYTKEKGKNLATTADFDRLSQQLAQTTKVAEQVKSEITGKAWMEQQIWGEKRRLHTKVLQAFYDVSYASDGMAGPDS